MEPSSQTLSFTVWLGLLVRKSMIEFLDTNLGFSSKHRVKLRVHWRHASTIFGYFSWRMVWSTMPWWEKIRDSWKFWDIVRLPDSLRMACLNAIANLDASCNLFNHGKLFMSTISGALNRSWFWKSINNPWSTYSIEKKLSNRLTIAWWLGIQDCSRYMKDIQ